MMANTALYATLTWIFDTILPSNRGALQVIPGWLRRKRTKTVTIPSDSTGKSDSVEEETEKVKLTQKQHSDSGLQIVNMTHIYRKSPCGFSTSDDITALSGVYLTADRDEVLTLLGHNGAGKSTLMSILTGMISPTSGTAIINGCDIHSDLASIRRHTGYCPQHSILWEELTAYEHIYLFTRLKGCNRAQAHTRTMQMLREVDLERVKEERAGTFSGGMRRRLSIALAGTGSPDILLLDEPTTGLDPINRFHVWRLIHQLKRSRVVVLTTHSMEEAEALSDKIGIMVQGKLRCIGSSLYLKNRFGGGYQVCLLTKHPDTVLSRITAFTASTTLLTHNADSLTIGLPDFATAQAVFGLIEGGLDGLVTEWGLRHPSLEQAFLEVTGSLDK